MAASVQFMPRVRSRREGGMLVIEVENTHGGARRGAGRRPRGRRAGVAHRRRRDVRAGLPIHVSTEMVAAVGKVSRRRRYQVIRRALNHGSQRPGFRVCHFSIARSSAHFVIEADDPGHLHRGMTGLLVRLARGLNRVGARRGQVFPDRYRHRVMSSPAQVHRTLSQLVKRPPPPQSIPSSFTAPQLLGLPAPGRSDNPALAPPSCHLLARAWRRLGPLPL
ncbi:MAG: hypothetical protein KJO07_22360 [Deltaproteobacteria bacterium]|nr:hypothetical protein [Deltaproteobacteria bacterium]